MSKVELLEKIAEQVRVCIKCPLWKGRRNAAPGEGNTNAAVMFVGEAPGYWEDMKGRPFVGAAGKVLDALLEWIKLPRESVFITSVVKCRPPENREPKPDEIKTCTSLYLDRQTRIIKPQIVVALGRHSTGYVLSKAGLGAQANDGITALHGKVIRTKLFRRSVTVIPMFHPAAVLHNPKYREMLENDFEVLKKQLRKLG